MRLEILAHVEVPHVSYVHRLFITDVGSWGPNLLAIHVLLNLLPLNGSLLSIQSLVYIVTVVKMVPYILLNFFFNRINIGVFFLADGNVKVLKIIRNESQFCFIITG